MAREVCYTDRAPAPSGPYSQAVRANGFVFVSGQDARSPEPGGTPPVSLEEQTRQTLRNLRLVLEAAGSGLESVVKTTCFLTDIASFDRFNMVYREFFPSNAPARVTVEVSALVGGILVEVDAVALVREGGGARTDVGA